MLIKLARDWFAPNATFYKAQNSPHDVPDSFLDVLPNGAEVLDSGPAPIPAKSKAEAQKEAELVRSKKAEETGFKK